MAPELPPGSWGGEIDPDFRNIQARHDAQLEAGMQKVQAMRKSAQEAQAQQLASQPAAPRPAEPTPEELEARAAELRARASKPVLDETRTVGINAGALSQDGLNDMPAKPSALEVALKRSPNKVAGQALLSMTAARELVEGGKLSAEIMIDLMKGAAEIQYAIADALAVIFGNLIR